MERSEILELMSQLQLAGMRAAYDEIVTTGVKRAQGIERVIVVTHGYHMPRALDNFRRAMPQNGVNMLLVAAPMGITPMFKPRLMDFLPTRSGYNQVGLVLHEFIGRLAGA